MGSRAEARCSRSIGRREGRPASSSGDSNLASCSSLGTETQIPPAEVLEKACWWSPESSAFSAARRARRFATEEDVGASSCSFVESSMITIAGRSGSTGEFVNMSALP